jgi:hypothetical protein
MLTRTFLQRRNGIMSSSPSSRLAAIALLVGSVLTVLTGILGFFFPGPLGMVGPPPVWLAWISIVAGILTLVGLPLVYRAFGKNAGATGLIGFIALFLALLIFTVVSNLIVVIFFTNYVPPKTPSTTPPAPDFIFLIFIVGGILLLIGVILLGITILRTHVFPHWTAWTLIAAGVLNAITLLPLPDLASTILGPVSELIGILTLAWFGYLLAFKSIGTPATSSNPDATAASQPAP